VRTCAGVPAAASLLLGLWDADGRLVHVGVSSSFADEDRLALHALVRPLAMPLAGHPWERGFNLGASLVGRLAGSAGRWDPALMSLDWIAVAPERVVEVAYDRLDGLRFRHPARLVRFRPDRDPRSCTLDQLVEVPEPPPSFAQP
jgi:ATP-dependent DNA ligase